jgi:hypothetical protein
MRDLCGDGSEQNCASESGCCHRGEQCVVRSHPTRCRRDMLVAENMPESHEDHLKLVSKPFILRMQEVRTRNRLANARFHSDASVSFVVPET